MASLPKLEARYTVTSGTTISVTETNGGGTFTVTITAGDYYFAALATQLAADITANATSTGTYTGTVSDDSDTAATGKTTLAVSGGGVTALAVTWTGSTGGTALRDILGFTANLSGALTFTSTNHGRLLWLPNVGRTRAMGPEPTSSALRLGIPMCDLVTTFAPSGASTRSAHNLTYHENLEFYCVSGVKTFRRLESVTNESFESFYEYAIKAGRPMRYYPARDTDGTYGPFVFGPDAGMLVVEPVNESWVNSVAAPFRVGPYEVFEYV